MEDEQGADRVTDPQRIPISRPMLGEAEAKAVLEPLQSGWVVQGPKVLEFERLFTGYTGSGHAVATTSCTTALHLALAASEIGPGDEVVLPAFTWVATANVVELCGARPVFADIALDTFNVSATTIEKVTTERTAGIIPVSLFGLCVDMPPIMELAARHGARVIEDAACGLGAWDGENHAGTLSDMGCFSFHPRKAITTGEGGMLITGDDELAALCRSLRDHGASVSDFVRHHGSRSYLLPEFHRVGYNYRMTDMQGAVGVAQMSRLEGILEERAEVARRYDEQLADIPWLRTPAVPAGYRHGYQSYVCLFQPEEPTMENVHRLRERRNALMQQLEGQGIATRPGTHAVHMLHLYRERYGIDPGDFPNAMFADHLSLALPLFAGLTESEQNRVVGALREAKP